jgi:hypothetical protein
MKRRRSGWDRARFSTTLGAHRSGSARFGADLESLTKPLSVDEVPTDQDAAEVQEGFVNIGTALVTDRQPPKAVRATPRCARRPTGAGPVARWNRSQHLPVGHAGPAAARPRWLRGQKQLHHRPQGLVQNRFRHRSTCHPGRAPSEVLFGTLIWKPAWLVSALANPSTWAPRCFSRTDG